MNDQLQKLGELFARFPGIGERQAKRFVYFLLASHPDYVRDLSALMNEIKKHVTRCSRCFRFFQKTNSELCLICSNAKRDSSTLMIVEKDADLESMEKSRTYSGLYFVFGGLVPLVEKETPERVRTGELLSRIKKETEARTLKEIVLAFSLNPQGEHTDTYIRELLNGVVENKEVKISSLGRGLSTGTELEYSDTDTLKNALMNRQ